MDWKEVTVTTEKAVSDAIIDILRKLGARGVVISEQKQNLSITAYYPDNDDFDYITRTIKNKINGLMDFGFNTKDIKITVRDQYHQDWTTSWHNFFKPIIVGDNFLICPSWEKCTNKDRIIIEIDPGMAFGTGSHESTRLCLLLLEKYLTYNKKNNKKIKNMLDVGAGSGILSIAAAHLGVPRIISIDKDDNACQVIKKNIEINNVTDQITVLKRDFADGIGQTFPLVVANLLSVIIKKLLPQLSTHIDKGGLLILSGIMERNKSNISSLLPDQGLTLIDEKKLGDWVGLVIQKG